MGLAYCVEWPEWHVDCAHNGCDESLPVAPLGECWTAPEAEKRLRVRETEDVRAARGQACGEVEFGASTRAYLQSKRSAACVPLTAKP